MARILIIDDEESVRLAIRQMVEWAGHEAVEAANGERGVALQRENPADLIIADMIMPGKHGVDVVVELMRAYPEVPIIAISGGTWRDNVDYLPIARKLGVRLVLDKPFEMSRLLRAVCECLAADTPAGRVSQRHPGRDRASAVPDPRS